MEQYWRGIIYYDNGERRTCGVSNDPALAERMAQQIFTLEAKFPADERRPVRIEVVPTDQR